MTKLSVAIATRNEEENIKDCLESVKWADEIVIYDEKSVDKTITIAKRYTSKIFLTNHDPMFHKTKQKAIDKSTGDWVLSLDADERVSLELKQEILEAINRSNGDDGYEIPRKSRIFGKWIEHTGWYPDYQMKLFKKSQGHYPCKSVHELIEIKGQVGVLTNALLHEHYSTIDWFLNRRFEYTKDDAQNIISRNEKIIWTDAIRFPADEFFKRFFYWQGYKDGFHGLVLSLLMAFDRLIVFARIWESQKFWQHDNANFRSQVINYSRKIRHDWNYWLTATEKNPILAIWQKLKTKLNS